MTVGNGVMAAFGAKDKAQVDRVYKLALSLGGTCEGPPGPRSENVLCRLFPGSRGQQAQRLRDGLIQAKSRLTSLCRATSKVRRWRVLLLANRRFTSTPIHGPSLAQQFPPHRRQGRLVAPDRFRRRRSAGVVAVGARGRRRETAQGGARGPDRLVGLDCARPQPPEIAARPAETRRKPGRGGGGPDRAGADLVGSAWTSRHRRRADSGDAAGHRGTPPLSQRTLDHRKIAGMARGACHQRERHGCHQRNPLRRQ